ncbi:MAG: phage tail protein [Alphaproteobacteria bacterium]|nr:MAG: phage tail protein [Alphaproteobacteria bacterium]
MAFLHGVDVVELTDGVRPIQVVSSSIIGIVGTAPFADADAFPLDTPVLISSPAQAAGLTATLPPNSLINVEGTLPWAIAGIFDQVKTPVVVIRVAADADAPDQQALVVGQADENTGVYGFLGAQASTGAKPKILIAPGFTHQQLVAATANPVVQALKSVANKLRAIVIADGPNDTNAAAIAKAVLEGADRAYHIDPFVKVLDRTGVIATRPASGFVAGVIARTDQTLGFWWSPSNQVINGIVGIGRPIEFGLSDESATSNLLNEAGVATIVAMSGFRVWGNRTKTTDPLWQFLSVRRTADMVYEAIEQSFIWAMDRPISGQLLGDVEGSVNAYLRDLKARGAILGGKATLNPDLNTEASLKAGRLYVDFDIEPPAPLERITFQARRDGGYYADVIASAVQAAA